MYITTTAAIAAAALGAVANAHISMFHPAMFGFDYPSQSAWPYNKTDGPEPNWNSDGAKHPLRQDMNSPESYWLGNGMRDYPPSEGVFLELESGGELTLDVNENRAFTRWRQPNEGRQTPKYAAQTEGPLHTVNDFEAPVDITKFGGTAIAIAYTSDEKSVRGEDFTVISTNWASPWISLATYPIPSGLPPCPPGGCLCTWNWIHTKNNVRHNPGPGRPDGEGYGDELYNVLFRCTVTGASDAGNVVPKGAVPTACTGELELAGGELSNCTTGPKQPMYLWMADGNNLFVPKDVQGFKNPTYNWRYGFSDGAQQDAVVKKGDEANANGKGSVSNKPRPNGMDMGKGGLAVVNARGEAIVPGPMSDKVLGVLKADGVRISTAEPSIDGIIVAGKVATEPLINEPETSTSTTASAKPEGTAPANATVEASGNIGNVHIVGSTNATTPELAPAGNATVDPTGVANTTVANTTDATPATNATTPETPAAGNSTVDPTDTTAPTAPSPPTSPTTLGGNTTVVPDAVASNAAVLTTTTNPASSNGTTTPSTGSQGAYGSTHGSHGPNHTKPSPPGKPKSKGKGKGKCKARRRRRGSRLP